MSLSLFQQVVKANSHVSESRSKMVETVSTILGKKSAKKIFESYQVSQDDYSKWLEVVLGYAADEGINIKNKGNFFEVAFSVLENDPVGIDYELQETIANKLWVDYKAHQQHQKVSKVVQAKEEEEQLKYAIKKMKKGIEDEEFKPSPRRGSKYNRLARASSDDLDIDNTDEFSMESSFDPDYDSISLDDYPTDYSSNGEGGIKSTYRDKQRWDDSPSDLDLNLERKYSKYREPSRDEFNGTKDLTDKEYFARYGKTIEDEESYDQSVPAHAWSTNSGSSEFTSKHFEDDWGIDEPQYDEEDYDSDEYDLEKELPFTDDEIEQSRDAQIMSRGKEMQHSRNLEDFDLASKEKLQKANRPAPEEEESNSLKQGQIVKYKKDGASYKVEIPDGPGSTVGVLMGSRIKMIPIKDLEVEKVNATHEEEEETNGTGSKSFLHQLLTGENSKQHLSVLQKQVEDEGANEFAKHFSKSPKNPHTKGSFAHKAWQKGFDSSAKEIWAPKPVEIDPKQRAKSKVKKK